MPQPHHSLYSTVHRYKGTQDFSSANQPSSQITAKSACVRCMKEATRERPEMPDEPPREQAFFSKEPACPSTLQIYSLVLLTRFISPFPIFLYVFLVALFQLFNIDILYCYGYSSNYYSELHPGPP